MSLSLVGGERENSVGGERLPPLFGQFCCRLAVQPFCREEAVIARSLAVRPQEEPGVGWQEGCWGSLCDWRLSSHCGAVRRRWDREEVPRGL